MGARCFRVLCAPIQENNGDGRCDGDAEPPVLPLLACAAQKKWAAPTSKSKGAATPAEFPAAAMGLLSVGISQGVDTHSMLAEIMAKVADLAKSVGGIEAELRGRGAKDKGNQGGAAGGTFTVLPSTPSPAVLSDWYARATDAMFCMPLFLVEGRYKGFGDGETKHSAGQLMKSAETQQLPYNLLVSTAPPGGHRTVRGLLLNPGPVVRFAQRNSWSGLTRCRWMLHSGELPSIRGSLPCKKAGG